MKINNKNKVSIIGAGLGGCIMSMYLAREGQKVDLIEKRADSRLQTANSARSINLTLATRALLALDELGIRDSILKHTVPLKGRLIHKACGKKEFQPYGKAPRDKIYSISRATLNNTLLDHVDTYQNINVHFNTACVDLDKNKRQLHLLNSTDNTTHIEEPDLIIGADGCFSTVREKMNIGEISSKKQERHNWGYKELIFPADENGQPCMQADVLHVWPRGDSLLLAMPNNDGSFTGTLCMPLEGETGFPELKDVSALTEFCEREYKDLKDTIPYMVEILSRIKVSAFMSTSVSPWFFDDWIALLGDACHTVLPFYGQGMNAAFEDCSVLQKIIGSFEDRREAFKEYERERKRNTDALTELSEKNFVELRESIQSPLIGFRKKFDYFLHNILEDRWIPIYTLVAQSNIPFADCVKIADRQNRILKWIGVDLILRIYSLLVVLLSKSEEHNPKPAMKLTQRKSSYIEEFSNIELKHNIQEKEQRKTLDVTSDNAN